MKASAFLCLQLLLLSPGNVLVGAQTSSPASNDNMYPGYARFNPSMTIIIVILIASLFFLTFFALYIRHCFDSSGAAGSVRRALSMRYHWTAGSRGLDPSVIENFPVFSYAEVKAHKIGKEALECAVCLNEFGEDETLRLLPKCDHVFHPECIGAWLRSNVTCPVCRANLAPQPADEPVTGPGNDNLECGDSSNEETVIDVGGDQSQGQEAPTNRDSSLQKGPERSWSTGKPKLFDLAKFRSHSTGHSLVQPGENLERFTLRLPEEIRKEVMERAAANRTRSRGTTLAREESSRRWYRTEAGEGSSRAGWVSRRIDRSDRQSKSDRWVSVARGFSMMRSTKVVAPAETGDSVGPSTTTPSFSDDPSRHPDLV